MDNKKNEEEDFQDGKIINREIVDEMKTAYIDYAMSVIVQRALPDVRDGLKPVHRRILYTMYEDGLTTDKPYRKSATTVGDVLGRYHPHGDSSVYDAMVRLAQDFSMRYPLIDGHGNFGSVDGDSAAAYRYTEARMAKIAETMLADIEKNTVDFMPNFDGVRQEPTVLPTRLPNLLVNGSSGIAVGMATNIPPHNLTEILNAVIKILEKLPKPVRILYTMFIVMIGWVFFSSRSFAEAAATCGALFGGGMYSFADSQALYYLRTNLLLLVFCVLGSTAWPFRFYTWTQKKYPVISAVGTVLLTFLAVAFMVYSTYQPFLYAAF